MTAAGKDRHQPVSFSFLGVTDDPKCDVRCGMPYIIHSAIGGHWFKVLPVVEGDTGFRFRIADGTNPIAAETRWKGIFNQVASIQCEQLYGIHSPVPSTSTSRRIVVGTVDLIVTCF